VQATLEFYENAFGFERLHLNAEENGAYGELSTGETTLPSPRTTSSLATCRFPFVPMRWTTIPRVWS
jgi:hypothetical protein